MLKSYKQDDYSVDNWKKLLDIKAAADRDFDNAATVTEVMTVLNNADAAMAAVPTLLDDAKAAAHASLNAAIAGYAQEDYSPENWAVLLDAMTIGDIDHAASVEDVKEALDNMLAAMTAVHTLLDDAKSAAHAGLEAVFAAYAEADYTPDDWTALTGFKTAGEAAIDGAADPAGAEAALSAAEAGMAGVQTIARILAAAKTAAQEALTAAFDAYSESDYTGDDWTVLTGFKTAGEAAIDGAADPAGAEAALSAAEAGMAGVQTIAQTLAAAKSVAHDVLDAAFTVCESNDAVDGGTASAGPEEIDDTAADADTVVDQTEEPAAEDSSLSIESEAEKAGPANDETTASQEVTDTGGTPCDAQEQSGDLEIEIKCITPDIE